MLEVGACQIRGAAAHAVEVPAGEVNPYRSNQNRRHVRPSGPTAQYWRSSRCRRGTSCGRGGWRRASCRGSAYHEADKDILLRIAADDHPPISPTANGRLPHRAVVVVVALVGWLYPRIGLSRQARFGDTANLR